MPRKPRRESPVGIYHVFARGNNGQIIFRDDGDAQVYLVIARGVIRVYRWCVLEYCLMSNHVHFVVETEYDEVGAGVQRLHGHYGRYFNRRYDGSGHVFRRPYGVTPIEDAVHLQVALAYVADNPVKAGLCPRPEDWPRSSCAEVARAECAPVANRSRAAFLLG